MRQYVQEGREVGKTVIALGGQDLNAAKGPGDLIDLIHYGPSDSVLLPRCMVEADRVDICLFEDFEKDDDLFGAVHALLDAYAARHPGDLCLRKGERQCIHHLLKAFFLRVGGEDGDQKGVSFRAKGTKGTDDASDLGGLGNGI